VGSVSRPTSWDGAGHAAAAHDHPHEGHRTQVLPAMRLEPRPPLGPSRQAPISPATSPAASPAALSPAASSPAASSPAASSPAVPAPAAAPGPLARIRAWMGGSAWVPLLGKLGGYVAGFVALALVGSGAASWRLGASGGALAMGLGPATPPPPPSPSAAAAPGAAMAGALGAGDEAPHESPADAGAPDAAPSGDGGGSGAGITTDGRIVLNVATEDELRRLPGVGPSKARAIVALRTKLGKFKRPEDLLRVKGIGRRSLARMRPLLLVDAP